MITVKIVEPEIVIILNIPAKITKNVLIDLRDYPQEDCRRTLECRANFYLGLSQKRLRQVRGEAK